MSEHALARTERLVKERMTLFDANVEIMTPQKLINPKALSAAAAGLDGSALPDLLEIESTPGARQS